MRDAVFFYAKNGYISKHLDGISKMLNEYRPVAQYKYSVWHSQNEKIGAIVVEDKRRSKQFNIGKSGSALEGTKQRAVTFCGYITVQKTNKIFNKKTSGILDHLTFTDGSFRVTSPLGGVHSLFYADNNRDCVIAFPNRSQVEQVFYTEGPEIIAVSNRPLFSHLAAKQSSKADLNQLYGRSIFLGGSTLHEDTPYIDTYYTKPKIAVHINSLGIKFITHPTVFSPETISSKGPRLLKEFENSLKKSLSPIKQFKSTTFHLSGGKDSRFVGALLNGYNKNIHARTFGSEFDNSEGPLSKVVAKELNITLEVKDQKIAEPEIALEVFKENLRRSQGLLCENFHYFFDFIPYTTGVKTNVFLEGQAHHPRGGYIRSMKIDKVQAINIGRKQWGSGDAFAPIDLIKSRDERITELYENYQLQHPAEFLYLIYGDYRMGRWLQAGLSWLTTNSIRIWPLIDEDVLSVCSKADIGELANETLFYSMLAEKNKTLASLPLFNSGWKFDRGGVRSFYKQYAKARNKPIIRTEQPKNLVFDKTLFNSPTMALNFIQTEITKPCYSNILESILRPEIIKLLLDKDFNELRKINQPAPLVPIMWRVFGICLLLEGSWRN